MRGPKTRIYVHLGQICTFSTAINRGEAAKPLPRPELSQIRKPEHAFIIDKFTNLAVPWTGTEVGMGGPGSEL